MSQTVRGLFIAGADTEVGKTYVGSLIARQLAAAGHRVGIYKPAESGCEMHEGRLVPRDALGLWQAAGSPGELQRVCPQQFAAPLAPALAAAAEGRDIDRQLLVGGLDYWLGRSDVVIVEGAGGLLTPLADDCDVATLAAEIGFPLVIVARNTLGAINQTLQTLAVARMFAPRLPLGAVVLSTLDPEPHPSLTTNAREIRRRASDLPLVTLGYRAGHFSEPLDWFAMAQPRTQT